MFVPLDADPAARGRGGTFTAASLELFRAVAASWKTSRERGLNGRSVLLVSDVSLQCT